MQGQVGGCLDHFVMTPGWFAECGLVPHSGRTKPLERYFSERVVNSGRTYPTGRTAFQLLVFRTRLEGGVAKTHTYIRAFYVVAAGSASVELLYSIQEE